MRALLFVQRAGLPKCVGKVATSIAKGGPIWHLSEGRRATIATADAWWLVWCDNADAGRACIRLNEAAREAAGKGTWKQSADQYGRILDSGRK